MNAFYPMCKLTRLPTCAAEHTVLTAELMVYYFVLYSLSYNLRHLKTAYMSCPAHIEIFAEEKNNEIAKEKETVAPTLTKKRAAQLRRHVKVGGGVSA